MSTDIDQAFNESKGNGKKPREFSGWKSHLVVNADGLSVELDVRYQKVESKDTLDIVRRSKISGNKVQGKWGQMKGLAISN
jgi:hypothetical protein